MLSVRIQKFLCNLRRCHPLHSSSSSSSVPFSFVFVDAPGRRVSPRLRVRGDKYEDEEDEEDEELHKNF